MPISVHASGVFVAPAKTATKPSPAKRSTGACVYRAITFPRVAPMKNNGVTSPPLKPQLNVTAVKMIFHSQLQFVAPPALKLATIDTCPLGGGITPSPR